ncbi:hypothetical protein Pan258_35210 [Symmachiella dynata]|uniref:hypothetical protein n=1 Tax=Symmachiella dynata TaxID=2527995 RepID=UPI00118B2117|nr:hypothetical protein [Symmachiella dynata]QDT49472.1 hypothetical protein Pan258_35210 [Symmachiella dynata]
MACSNCQRLAARVATLETAASHVQIQQRLNRLHSRLIDAGLNPLDVEAVSPTFIGWLLSMSESGWQPLIQDRAAVIECVRAKRANATAESDRITFGGDDD